MHHRHPIHADPRAHADGCAQRTHPHAHYADSDGDAHPHADLDAHAALYQSRAAADGHRPACPCQQVPVSLLTYYDANNSNKYDPGEGIVGISARVIDLTTGKLLAQGLTDETGRVAFTVSAPGAVQLVVPYLSFSEIILPSGKAVTVRVSRRDLPRAIP